MKRYLIIISYLFIVMTSFAQQFELSRAKRLIQRQEYLEAARILRPLAESGNAEAQHLAAGLFMEGKGVIKSPKQAEMYYTKAAKADYEPSVLALFDYYEQTNKQVEAAQLLANKYVKQTLPTSLYAKYGLYLYQGKGNLKEDKLTGWKMIFNNNGNVDDVLKQDFYESIIQLGKEQPDSTLSLFCKDLWSNENTKLEWTINYMDDVMQLIQVSDSTQQKR
ncbi:MAG: sel1 repeat family protein, partial [Bacteroidaceae bacterium]|nr:sel1 repeat family protein [Bacteroidaceae bacterium]